MRRASGSVLVALVVALILPTSVLAAKAERQTDTSLQLWCGDLQSEAGSAYVNAWIGDMKGGRNGATRRWHTGPR